MKIENNALILLIQADKDKFPDFFLIDIKTSRRLHFEAYVYLRQIYEDLPLNHFQTKLHRSSFTRPHLLTFPLSMFAIKS